MGQMRALVLATVLSLGLAGCGGGSTHMRPVTVNTSPASLGPILIAADTISIAGYCLHQTGTKIGKQTPPTAKQRLYELRALKSLQSVALAQPHATYRGKPLRAQLELLATLLGSGRCDPPGAKLMRELSSRLP